MTSIFISHSSADNDAAIQIKAWLASHGHTATFLDLDPTDGIRAGSDWEKTLYHQLRSCQAVIALLTPSWFDSKWCFAELALARERGKAVFPVKVRPCNASELFSQVQHVDLAQGMEQGLQRLLAGLLEAGLDPNDIKHWNPNRSPYPGLLAFQAADAAVFFGRDADVIDIVETLSARHRQGATSERFVVLLGNSGSGKSSLLRAGVLPRLNKAPELWQVLPTMRPQSDPIGELATALSAAFAARGQVRPWSALRDALWTAASQDPCDGQCLSALARELLLAAGQPEAVVLVTVDQAEELLGGAMSPAALRFLLLLRASLAAAPQRLLAVATLRSDFLGEFQAHAAATNSANSCLRYHPITIDPIAQSNFHDIVRGPARLAGIVLDDDLAAAMVEEAATPDALPLLAFTLRRLYDRHGTQSRWTLAQYVALGRLEGSVREVAEGVIAESRPTAGELDALRTAFVPAMVRITPDGAFVRRPAVTTELPERASRLLARLVDARLLVAGRDAKGDETIEVAHEALLRTWPQLGSWLAEDLEKLRILEGLQRAANEWHNGGRRDDLLVHRDRRLNDVLVLVAQAAFVLPQYSHDADYLLACDAAQVHREEATRQVKEQQLQAARAMARRTAIGLVAALLVATLAGWQWWRAEVQSRLSFARELAVSAAAQLFSDPELALLLAQQAAEVNPGAETTSLLRRALLASLGRTVMQGHTEQVNSVAFSGDGRQLLTTQGDGFQPARVWDVATGRQLVQIGEVDDAVREAHFSPDSQAIVTAERDGMVRLWDAASGQPLRKFSGHTNMVYHAEFSPDGKSLVSASQDGSTRIWDVRDGRERARLCTRSAADSAGSGSAAKCALTSVAHFSPDSRRVLTSGNGVIVIWDAEDGARLAQWGEVPHGQVHFSPTGHHLLILPVGGSAFVLDARSGRRLAELPGTVPSDKRPAFSADGQAVIVVSGDPSQPLSETERLRGNSGARQMHLVELASGRTLQTYRGHTGDVIVVAMSNDGKTLASGGKDHTVRLWNVATGQPLATLIGHGSFVTSLTFSADDRLLASGGEDHTARVWQTDVSRPLLEVQAYSGSIAHLSISADGEQVAAVGSGHMLRTWNSRTGQPIASWSIGAFDRVEGPSGTAHILVIPRREVIGRDHFAVWSVFDGKKTGHIEGFFVPAPTVTPDGRHVVAQEQGGTGMLWKLPAAELVSGPEARVRFFACSSDCSLTIAEDMKLRDSKSMTVIHELEDHPGGVESAEFSPDDSLLVSAGRDGSTRIWDVYNGRQVHLLEARDGKNHHIRWARFSLDGRRVLARDHDTLRVWDVQTGTPLGVFGDRSELVDSALSADGEILLTVRADGGVRVFEVTSAQELMTLREPATRAAFGPGATWLATATADGKFRTYECEVCASRKDLLTLARARRWREFSADERRRFLHQSGLPASPMMR